ncbi:hypothetical protein AVEN_99758-1 [Araneus ventricosus]|uniref:Uncharacterized protein n=1 Tax=Araneus ventricosus TaxID=182803 RepID=A0A4Y2DMI8_ARAVE|nr:hypothetical protein AVEN_99758-1 [Araneus ventricosus]
MKDCKLAFAKCKDRRKIKLTNKDLRMWRCRVALDEDLTKNVDATEESSVCSLAHRDKVRCPSVAKLWDTVWKDPPFRPTIRA